MKRFSALVFGTALLLLSAGAAKAAIVAYTDLASWQAAASSAGLGTAVETFDSYPNSTDVGSISPFSVGPVQFDSLFCFGCSIFAGKVIAFGAPPNIEIISLGPVSGPPLAGISFNWIANTGQSNFFDLTFIAPASGQTSVVSDSHTSGFSESGFIGYLFDPADLSDGTFIFRAAYELERRGSDLSLDNFRIAYAPAAVPIPAAVWLFGSGLIGLVGVARRRKS